MRHCDHDVSLLVSLLNVLERFGDPLQGITSADDRPERSSRGKFCDETHSLQVVDSLRFANIPTAVRITAQPNTSRPNDTFGLPTTLMIRLHTKGDLELPMAISRRANGLTLPSVAEALQARTKGFLPVRREASCKRNCPAGPGRCVCACLYGRERDLGRGVRHETRVGANEANRHAASEWRRPTHRATTALAETTGQRRRRLRRRHPHPRTSAAI